MTDAAAVPTEATHPTNGADACTVERPAGRPHDARDVAGCECAARGAHQRVMGSNAHPEPLRRKGSRTPGWQPARYWRFPQGRRDGR
jgi:hypothetical protein